MTSQAGRAYDPIGGTPSSSSSPPINLEFIVTEALRLMPAGLAIQGGQGHGDGPPPILVDAIVTTLQDLYQTTGGTLSEGRWLALALDIRNSGLTKPTADGGSPDYVLDETTAMLALSAKLTAAASLLSDSGTGATIDPPGDDDTAAQALLLFSTVPDSLPKEKKP